MTEKQYEKKFRTTKETMEFFSVTKPTLAQWVKEGMISDLRTPKGHRRFDWDEIIEMMKWDKQKDRERKAMLKQGKKED